MGDKSPKKSSAKTAGKSIKEKRADKHAKSAAKINSDASDAVKKR